MSHSMWANSVPNLSFSIQTKPNQLHTFEEQAVSHGLKELHLEEETARVGLFSNTRDLVSSHFTAHLSEMKTSPRRSKDFPSQKQHCMLLTRTHMIYSHFNHFFLVSPIVTLQGSRIILEILNVLKPCGQRDCH